MINFKISAKKSCLIKFFVKFSTKDKFSEDPSLNDVYGGKLENYFFHNLYAKYICNQNQPWLCR